MPTSGSDQARIVSLDQFRGYTVAGMLLVNFLAGYQAVGALLKHHNTYCSYADTIMPQFFFAVGFAYRLTFLRRQSRRGTAAAVRHALARCAGLILLGVVLYHLDGKPASWAELTKLGVAGFLRTAFQRDVFQTLVHIGLTCVWVLPVIAARPAWRIAFLVASAAAHLALSHEFYFDWVWHRPGIDGGPLGFLTWSIPLLVGSLAYDVVAAGSARPMQRLLGWSIVLMVLGYGLSCLGITTGGGSVSAWSVGLAPAPFVPPDAEITMWSMSQRAGSVSYQTFAAGFSLAAYALFVLACDRRGWRLGLFRTFGQNALAAYVLHELVAQAVQPYVPRDAPLWFVLAGFALFFGVTYVLVRSLEKRGIFLRL